MIFQAFKCRPGKVAKKCMTQKGAIHYQSSEVSLGQPAIHLFI